MLTRREFLQVSATAPLALGALGLFGRIEAAAVTIRTPLLILFLSGGISAKEWINPDPPSSAAELRGPLGSAATRIPGVHFSEVWPSLAERADKFSVLRSLDAGSTDHTPGMRTAVLQGNQTISERIGDRAADGGAPYVLLTPRRDWPGLNEAFRMNSAFAPLYREGRFVQPIAGDTSRLAERRRLLEALETPMPGPTADRMQRFRETAFDLLQGGGRFFEAMNLPAGDRGRYGGSLAGDMVLTAKRFIERGAGAVTVYHEPTVQAWDMHSGLEQGMRTLAPEMDRAASVLIDEIASSRLNCVLLMMGEINRTPRMNPSGRDHWRYGNCAVLAGGRIRPGVVHGRTDRHGRIVDGAVLQQTGLQNTVLFACGEDVSPAEPRVREVLR